MSGIAEKIKQQEKVVADSKKRIVQMKEQEAKRILRLADKVGFFEVDISDEQIRQSFERMVKAAKAPS